jgi:hypothetical protein
LPAELPEHVHNGGSAANAGPVAIDKAAVRRAGRDVTLITYGGSLWKTLDAAAALAADNIEAEVIDLRTLRPLDDQTIIASVIKTRRAIIVDEGWRSGSLAAEICARIIEQAFWELDAPVGRVCGAPVSGSAATLTSGTRRTLSADIPGPFCHVGLGKKMLLPPPLPVQPVSSATLPFGVSVKLVPPTAMTHGSEDSYSACTGPVGLCPVSSGFEPASPLDTKTLTPAAASRRNF